MNLEKDKQYAVNVKFSSSCLVEGTHILYFRDIFVSKDGLPVFNFSESLSYDSKYYNLFYPFDFFTMSLAPERDSIKFTVGCPCEAGRDP